MDAREEWHLARCVEAGLAAQAVLRRELTAPMAEVGELVRIVEEGRAAFTRLVETHVSRIRRHAAATARRHGFAPEDAQQEASLALLEAVWRFDWTRGWRLSTYASHWVENRLRECMATRAGIEHASPRFARDAMRVRMELGRRGAPVRVDVDAVALAVGLSPSRVRDVLAVEGTCPLVTDIEQDATAHVDLDAVLTVLDPAQERAIRMRFGLGERRRGLRGIAAVLDVPQRRVTALVEEGIAQLRRELVQDPAA